MVEGNFTTVNKKNNRDRQISRSKTSSLVQKIFRIDSIRASNKCSPFSKKFIYKKNPKPAIGRKTISFRQELGKVDQRLRNFVCRGVRYTIPKQVTASKTQELLINQEIMEMLDKRAIKKCKIISQTNS